MLSYPILSIYTPDSRGSFPALIDLHFTGIAHYIAILLTLCFVARLKPWIFRLSARNKPNPHGWTLWSYRWGLLGSAQFQLIVVIIELVVSNDHVIQTVRTGVWQVENFKRQFYEFTRVYTNGPGTSARVIVRQRVVVAGQASCVRI